MGGCSKTLKFVITIITWWLGVTKKWNCPLLFVTNLWCSHFFLQKRNFSTSQARKKSCLFFKPKACWFWTIVKQKNASLFCTTVLLSWQKEKKLLTSFVYFLLPSFWYFEKDKTKKLCFLCFVFGHRQSLPGTKWAEFCHLSLSFVKKAFVFLFLFVNQTS